MESISPLPPPTSLYNNIIDNRDNQEDSNEVVKHIEFINNEPQILYFIMKVNKYGSLLWHKLIDTVENHKKKSAKNKQDQTSSWMMSGKLLRQEAEKIVISQQKKNVVNPPPLKLKNIVGYTLGVLFIFGGATLYYSRKTCSETQKSNDEPITSHHLPIRKSSSHFQNKFIKSLYKNKFIHYDKNEVKFDKALLSKSITTNNKLLLAELNIHPDQQFILRDKEITLEKKDTSDINYKESIDRYRDKLIDYIMSFHNISSGITNDMLAIYILSIISRSHEHEDAFARIYLYKTFLYGERHNEKLSKNIQKILVSEMLANLLYGESMENHILNVFCKERYIPLSDFNKKLINLSLGDIGRVLSEYTILMRDYISICIPTILMPESSILTGSIIWFLIFISFSSEFDVENFKSEQQAIQDGLDIIKTIIAGNLNENSKFRIEFGLRIFYLYKYHHISLEQLPDINIIWQKFTQELVSQINFSRKKINVVNHIIEKSHHLNDKLWYSKRNLANKLLIKYCNNTNPTLYTYIGNNKKKNVISKNEFIELKNNHAWCKNGFLYKIPTVDFSYQKIINDSRIALQKFNALILMSSLYQSNHFNPYLQADDPEHIMNSNLTLVNLYLNKKRNIQELRIGPVLMQYKTKENFLFFQAQRNGIVRLYAIDIYHTRLPSRIIVDKDNLRVSLEMFFDIWPPYSNSMIEYIESESKKNAKKINETVPKTLSSFIFNVVKSHIDILFELIEKYNKDDISLQESIINSLKDLFIPFYSCVNSFHGNSADDLFVNCLSDGIFILIPGGKSILTISKKTTKKAINTVFKVTKKNALGVEKLPSWRNYIKDKYIYNELENEGYMLTRSIYDLVLGTIDPGVNLLISIKKTIRDVGKSIMKGDIIKAPYSALKSYTNIADATIKINSVKESVKQISITISEPSGQKLSQQSINDFSKENISTLSHGIVNFHGEYYTFLSKDESDIIIGAIEDRTENGDQIFTIMSGDQFSGILSRCICKEKSEIFCDLEVFILKESIAEKYYSNKEPKDERKYRHRFTTNTQNINHSLIVYSEYKCIISNIGSHDKSEYEIIQLNNSYYIFDDQKGTLSPLYLGDTINIEQKTSNDARYKFSLDKQSNDLLVIQKEMINEHFLIDKSYAVRESELSPKAKSHLNDREDEFIFLDQDNIYLISAKFIFNTKPTSIYNQFFITHTDPSYPSISIGWNSITNKMQPTKPYIQLSSPHIGISLEDFISIYEGLGQNVISLPTLLISGAVSSVGILKVKILGSYYHLGKDVNGLIPLFVDRREHPVKIWLRYDDFTESFEYFSSAEDYPFTLLQPSPYEKFIDRQFPKENYPTCRSIINVPVNSMTKLDIRLRQAAFLRRLSKAARSETLALPVAQVLSWSLHPEVFPLRYMYAAAIWLTWQRRVGSLFDGITPHQLMLQKKHLLNDTQIQDDISKNNGRMVIAKYNQYHAIWISKISKAFNRFIVYNNNIVANQFFPEHNVTEWFPDVDYFHAPSVSQFMFEDNAHPNVHCSQDKVRVYGTYLGKVTLEHYDCFNKLIYFAISPDNRWLATVNSEKNLLIYDLRNEKLLLQKNLEKIIPVLKYIEMKSFKPQSAPLFFISNEGLPFISGEHTWVEINGYGHLWSPPPEYKPCFITADQRFLGFIKNGIPELLIYDNKINHNILLRHHNVSNEHNYTLEAIAFSAMNALVATIFNDGILYLYDLIEIGDNSYCDPIAKISLENYNYTLTKGNTIIKFTGIFDSIHVSYIEEQNNGNNEVFSTYVQYTYPITR